MKRRKPKAERKETSIRFRLSPDDKTKLEAAAKRAHIDDLSTWIRATLLREAEKA